MNFNFVRVLLARSAVLIGEAGDDLGIRRAAMAGVAGHRGPSAEAALVERVDHENHLARGLFPGNVVGKLRPVFESFREVAMSAVQAQVGGKNPHCIHELSHGKPLKHLDVFENIVSHQRLLRWGGLPACSGNAQQANHRGSQGAKDPAPRSELHALFLPGIRE